MLEIVQQANPTADLREKPITDRPTKKNLIVHSLLAQNPLLHFPSFLGGNNAGNEFGVMVVQMRRKRHRCQRHRWIHFRSGNIDSNTCAFAKTFATVEVLSTPRTIGV